MLLLGVAALAASCSRGPSAPLRHADASGDFSAEIPGGWRAVDDPNLTRRPVAVVTFVGEVSSEDEGNPLGAVIHVTRVSRLPSDLPSGEKARRAFAASWLTPSDVLFGGSSQALSAAARKNLPRARAVSLGGVAARTYEREFEHYNPAHMPRPVPMRLIDIVARTDKAYFIVEYRATRDLFDKHRPVFERFLKGFAFGPSA